MDSKEALERIKQAEREAAGRLENARQEAQLLLRQARLESERIIREKEAQAKKDALVLREKAKRETGEEEAAVIAQATTEIEQLKEKGRSRIGQAVEFLKKEIGNGHKQDKKN